MENIKPQIEYNHLMECCCIFEAFNLERYFKLTEELYSLKIAKDNYDRIIYLNNKLHILESKGLIIKLVRLRDRMRGIVIHLNHLKEYPSIKNQIEHQIYTETYKKTADLFYETKKKLVSEQDKENFKIINYHFDYYYN